MTDKHENDQRNNDKDDLIGRLRKIKPQQDRLKAAHTIYGHQSADYHIGAALDALKEADDMASGLGVERLPLHSRLEQYAALAWQMKQGGFWHDGQWYNGAKLSGEKHRGAIQSNSLPSGDDT